MNWFKLIKFAQNVCKKKIVLSDREQSIFNLLLSAKQVMPILNNVEMRVAGGWVRDKLLHQESDDIDIAVSNITGAEFAQALKQFTSIQNIQGVGKTYIVDQNIEKSKHLATAGIDLFGQKVEFVNLRSEEYGDTRVPTMKMGTPEQDSKRRDLTINALFYNIETGKIEDYVGGCKDLENMILRTPLDPVKTFTDDPLRMLRVLRFYSRYPNAKIDPAIINAIKIPEVQASYSKLSPERAYPEIIKMMKGTKPVEATRILFETGLYKRVFGIPDDFMDIRSSQRSHWHQYTLMEHTLKVMENVYNQAVEIGVPNEETALLCLSAMFHDFGKMSPDIRKPHPKQPGYYQYIGHEDLSADIANKIMTQMGFTPEAKKFVTTVVAQHMKPHQEGLFDDTPKSKKRLGKLLKEVDVYYDKILMHGLADELAKGDISDEEKQQITDTRNKQIEYVEKYRQEQGERLKNPLLDGNKIRQILSVEAPELVNNNAFFGVKGFTKPVYFLAYAINRLLEQQWMGSVNTPEEAENFIRKNAKQWLSLWNQQQKN